MEINENDIDYIFEEDTLVEKTGEWIEFGYGKAIIFLKDGSSKETETQYGLLEKLKESHKSVLIITKNLKGDIEFYFNNELVAKKEKEKELEIIKETSLNIKEKFENVLKTGFVKF